VKNLKAKISDLKRNFRGLYDRRFDRFEDLPLGENRIILGETVEGREIGAYKFGRNGKVKILLLGGIYGNEIGTVKLMHHLVNYLDGRKQPILGVDIFVIPCLNLDGMASALEQERYFARSDIGRLNANKVDLGQNFETESFEPENFLHSGSGYTTVYCGETPLSEPESRHLADFMLEQGINVLYCFIGEGKEIFGNEGNLAEKLRKDFVKSSGYRYVDGEDGGATKITGTLAEWCYEKQIVYLGVRSGTTRGSDWKNTKAAIISGLKYHYG